MSSIESTTSTVIDFAVSGDPAVAERANFAAQQSGGRAESGFLALMLKLTAGAANCSEVEQSRAGQQGSEPSKEEASEDGASQAVSALLLGSVRVAEAIPVPLGTAAESGAPVMAMSVESRPVGGLPLQTVSGPLIAGGAAAAVDIEVETAKAPEPGGVELRAEQAIPAQTPAKPVKTDAPLAGGGTLPLVDVDRSPVGASVGSEAGAAAKTGAPRIDLGPQAAVTGGPRAVDVRREAAQAASDEPGRFWSDLGVSSLAARPFSQPVVAGYEPALVAGVYSEVGPKTAAVLEHQATVVRAESPAAETVLPAVDNPDGSGQSSADSGVGRGHEWPLLAGPPPMASAMVNPNGLSGDATPAAQRVPSRVISQIVKAVRTEVFDGGAGMTLRLDPPHLGVVHLNVVTTDGAVTANLQTSLESVRQMFESNVSALKEAMQQSGVNVDSINVSVGGETGQGRHAMPEGHGQPGAHQGWTNAAGVGFSEDEAPGVAASRALSNGGFDHLA